MPLSNLLVEHILNGFLSGIEELLSLCSVSIPSLMWHYIYQELFSVTFKFARFKLEETPFLKGLLSLFCFPFHDLSFPLAIFSSSFQPLLLLVFSNMVLSHRFYCCVEGLRNCMKNEDTGPPDLHMAQSTLYFLQWFPSSTLILLAYSTHDVFLFLCSC